MNLRQLVPTSRISEETLQDLRPIIEGEALRSQGRYREAEVKYREGLRKYQRFSGGRFLIYNKLGVLYEEMHDLPRAMEAYGRAAAEGSMTPFTYLRLGHLSLVAGEPDESIGYCDRGIEALRHSRTNFIQEIYFWCALKRTRRMAKRGLQARPTRA